MPSSRLFVGEARRRTLQEIEAAFESATAAHQPRLVVLEAPLGWGKTRLIQEFYESLAADQRYWPSSIVPLAEAPIRERKRIVPEESTADADAPMPWMWWGISCERREVGVLAQVLSLDVSQLLHHQQGLLRRGQRNRAVLKAAESAVNVALGFLAPPVSSALGGLQAVRDAYAAVSKEVADRGPGELAARELADLIASTVSLLRQIGKAGLPVVVVVDDAHLADPSITRLLSEIFVGPMPIGLLCIATAWPEEVARQREAGEDTFGRWLAKLEREQPDLVRNCPLAPLSDAALVDLVLERAPRSSDAVAGAIARRADGNPFVLRGLLDLPVVRRSCRDDAIDLPPEIVGTLPNTYESILRARWDALPEPVQGALCIASVMGPAFLRDLWLTAYDLAPLAESQAGVAALDEAVSPHAWLQAIGRSMDFVERYGFELAADALEGLLTPDELTRIRRGLIARISAWKKPAEWAQLSVDARQRLLMAHVHIAEADLPEDGEQLRAVIESATSLARMQAAAGDHRGASPRASRRSSGRNGIPTTTSGWPPACCTPTR